jgi:alpha-N-acetylglucosamine transferase
MESTTQLNLEEELSNHGYKKFGWLPGERNDWPEVKEQDLPDVISYITSAYGNRGRVGNQPIEDIRVVRISENPAKYDVYFKVSE